MTKCPPTLDSKPCCRVDKMSVAPAANEQPPEVDIVHPATADARGPNSRCMSAHEFFHTPTPLTVGAYCAAFFEDLDVLLALGQRSPKTVRSYVSIAKYSLGLEKLDGRWLVDQRRPLLARPVTELVATEIRNWHRSVASDAVSRARGNCKNGTRTANLSLVVLKLCLRMAEADRVIPIGSSPTQLVARFKETPRERYLTDDELAAVWQAIAKVERMRERNAVSSQRRFARCVTNALRLCLLLGLRKEEALRLQWGMVRFDERALHLPDTKTGYREVSLSDEAIAVLRAQLRARVDEWVFPSRVKRGVPITEVYDVWRQILDVSRIDQTGVVVHTTRHSLAENSLQRGEPIEAVSRLLGHKNTKITEEVYAKRRFKTRGTDELVQRHAAQIVRAA